jgi:hypothetical protein
MRVGSVSVSLLFPLGCVENGGGCRHLHRRTAFPAPRRLAGQVWCSSAGEAGGGRGAFYAFTSVMTMPTPTEDYVCTTCGFFDTYIPDQGKLDEVAKKWKKTDSLSAC